MVILNDLEIETLIIENINRLIEETDLAITLSASDEYGFSISLNSDKWTAFDRLDPLSCVLYFEKPNVVPNNVDNLAFTTIKKYLNRSAGWILSFQDAVRGKNNSSSSINGYICGRKVRQYVINTEKNIK